VSQDFELMLTVGIFAYCMGLIAGLLIGGIF
jgi:hypothetical protein